MGRRTERNYSKTKKKKSRKKILIPIVLILIAVVIGGAVFFIVNMNTNKVQPETETIGSTPVVEAEEVLDLPSLEERENTTIPVLMYHLVDEEAGALEGLYLRTSEFEEHLQYFKDNGFTGITMKDLQDYWAGTKALPEKPILLTFDDGSVTVYNNAFPLMKEYGFVSTQFIISSHVGNGGVMTEEQILEMSKEGHEIGSHSYSHLDLAAADESTLEQEISLSKKDLEALVGKPVVSFCYPAGKFDDNAKAYLENAGFKSAVTTVNGFANKTEQGPFALDRIRISRGDDGAGVSEKLAGYAI